MQRIFLFIVTNLAVLALLGLVVWVIERLTGIHPGTGGMGALLLLAAVSGFGGALISLALSKWTAKRAMAVRVVTVPASEVEEWLVTSVERLAAQARIGRPEIGIFEADEMNAFATGARRDAALVAVSSGLLQGMPRPQVEAVLAHEISHVANGDMVTLTLLQGVLNTFVIFVARLIGGLVDRMLFGNDRGPSGSGFFLATLIAQVVLGLFAGILVNWYSRRREFRADRGGAHLAGTENMLGALEFLRRGHGAPLPTQLRAFGIDTGDSAGFMRLLMSHPPLDARIAALRSSATGTST